MLNKNIIPVANISNDISTLANATNGPHHVVRNQFIYYQSKVLCNNLYSHSEFVELCDLVDRLPDLAQHAFRLHEQFVRVGPAILGDRVAESVVVAEVQVDLADVRNQDLRLELELFKVLNFQVPLLRSDLENKYRRQCTSPFFSRILRVPDHKARIDYRVFKVRCLLILMRL